MKETVNKIYLLVLVALFMMTSFVEATSSYNHTRINRGEKIPSKLSDTPKLQPSASDIQLDRRKRGYFYTGDNQFVCPTGRGHFSKSGSKSIFGSAMDQCEYPSQCRSQWIHTVDGCSAPFVGDMLNETFLDACNLHDLCYASPDASKRSCDKGFWKNMQQTCALAGKRSPNCRHIADTVYIAVVWFGGSSFLDGQNWANRNCRS